MVSVSGIWLELEGIWGREGKRTPYLQLSRAKSGEVPEPGSKWGLSAVSTASNDGKIGIISFLARGSCQLLRVWTPCVQVKGSPGALAVLMAGGAVSSAPSYSRNAGMQAWCLPPGDVMGEKWTEWIRCGLSMVCSHPRTKAKLLSFLGGISLENRKVHQKLPLYA